jgi:hypothetical protein
MLMNLIARVRHIAGLPVLGLATAAMLLSSSACTASTSASLDSTSATAQARRLAMGTLRLEGTPQAVDSQSAAELLPLWQLMDELSTNSASAPQEISAVVDRIRATMTTEQVGAIDEMTLSVGEVADPSAGMAASSTSGSEDAARIPVEAVVGGGMPPDAGGGIPGGPGMPSGPQGQNSGSPTGGATTSASSGVFQQVISLLQSKLQGEPSS